MTLKLRHDSDITPYLRGLTKDQRKVLAANPHRRHKVINAVVNYATSFVCTCCGKNTMPINEEPLTARTCSTECRNLQKAHMTGKKRPEHSAHMKVKTRLMIADGTMWGAAHRANNKLHLAKLNENLDRSQIVKTRSSTDGKRHKLNLMLSPNSKAKFKTHQSYLDSSLAKLTPAKIAKASAAQIDRWVRQWNSIKSTAAMERNPGMGATQFYKRILVKNLKHHCKRKSITTRSSLEYDFVKWLERVGYTWTYEWTKIQLGNGSVYIPDFKIKIGVDIWVVETKGFYRVRTNQPVTFKKEKVAAAWCLAKGYHYAVLSARQIGKLGEKVDPGCWIDLTEKTDKQIVKYLHKHIPGAINC